MSNWRRTARCSWVLPPIRVADVEFGWNHVGLEERVADGGIDWTRALSVVEHLCVSCRQTNLLCFVQAAEAMSHLIVPPAAAICDCYWPKPSALCPICRAPRRYHQRDWSAGAGNRYARGAGTDDKRCGRLDGCAPTAGLITYGGMTHNMDEAATRSLSWPHGTANVRACPGGRHNQQQWNSGQTKRNWP